MRKRNQGSFYRKGQLLKRIYQDDGSYEEIAQPFRYRGTGSAALTRIGGRLQTSGQLMPGFLHTDTSDSIEAITDLEYAKGDKVILDNGEVFSITQVNNLGFGELGRIRGIRRSSFTLLLS